MIRAIVFDWSGTLVDDLPAVWKATNYVLNQAGRPEMSLDEFRAEFCLPFTAFYDRHVPQVPISELEGWFHSHYVRVQDSVVALPHARSFLEFCRHQRLRMFLLSTVHPDHYVSQNRVTGFDTFFERAYVGIWDKRKKIGEIVQEHGLNPEESLFVGDMQHDIDTARHGGLHSCGVLTGYNTLAQLRAAEPDCIVEHLGELRELLETNAFPRQKGAAVSAHALHPVVTVGALVYNSAGNVLMVRTHKWSDKWGIPGGKIKWGETSEDALRREILEETNVEINAIEFVLVQDCIRSPEFYRESHFILLNYRCRAVGEPRVRLNDEAREFRWVTPEEALKLDLNQPTRVLLEAAQAQKPPC